MICALRAVLLPPDITITWRELVPIWKGTTKTVIYKNNYPPKCLWEVVTLSPRCFAACYSLPIIISKLALKIIGFLLTGYVLLARNAVRNRIKKDASFAEM